MTKDGRADWIFEVFKKLGHRQYGESVTKLQHALQTATFAQQFKETDAVVVASLLHDFGHLQHDGGEDIADKGIDMLHENLGAKQLGPFFRPEVVEPIRLHLTAKRYLCWQSKEYLKGLSTASQLSLNLQGGLMTELEAREFEKNPYFEAAVRLRRYDDMGKVPNMKTEEIGSFRALLVSMLVC